MNVARFSLFTVAQMAEYEKEETELLVAARKGDSFPLLQFWAKKRLCFLQAVFEQTRF